MDIVFAYPPNIKEIEAVFDLKGKKPVFAYGRILFNPHKSFIDQFLLCHELTHMKQQGGKVVEWWDQYLKDPEFRLKQEVEAYHNQYMLLTAKKKDRNKRSWYLHQLAMELAGPLYGQLLSTERAIKLIENGYDSSISK